MLINNQDKDTQQFNRYIDVLPYQHSMVSPHAGGYFNGNVVDLLGYRFFITQAPLDVKEFHDLTYENKIEFICQLSPFIEGVVPKVTRYVPLIKGEPRQFTSDALRAQYMQRCMLAQAMIPKS